jgi:hypothetical protein
MKPIRIERSFSGPMAAFNYCFPLNARRDAKNKWLTKRTLYLGNVSGYKRILTHVYIKTLDGRKYFLMDAITGTLYRREDGRCLTSDVLKLVNFSRERDLNKKLLNMKVADIGGLE